MLKCVQRKRREAKGSKGSRMSFLSDALQMYLTSSRQLKFLEPYVSHCKTSRHDGETPGFHQYFSQHDLIERLDPFSLLCVRDILQRLQTICVVLIYINDMPLLSNTET